MTTCILTVSLGLVTSFLEASAVQEVRLLGGRHQSGRCRRVEGVGFGSSGSFRAEPEGIRADARGSLACETGSLDVRRQQYCGVCMCVFWDQIYVEIARTVKTD